MDKSNKVGVKIKSLCESKSITIEQLAEQSSLSIDQIERIENNTDLPSLAPLIKIARALGVRLGTFMDDAEDEGPVICRAGDAIETISFSNNSVEGRKHMDYQSLAQSKTDRHMEPFLINVEPSNDDKFETSSHEGEEFIYVLTGTVEIVYGKNTYKLKQGDSIYYDSIIPHHVHAYKEQKAQILAVIYTPI